MTNTRPFRRAALIAGALAATLTFAACGSNEVSDTGSADTGSTDTTNVTSIAGEQLAVPGEKPTAVFFFSVSCGSCVEGVRSLGEAAHASEDAGIDANFLAVDVDPAETSEIIEDFMTYVDAEHVPAAIDTGAALTQRFEVAWLSTLIVVDTNGEVTYRGTDPSADQITAELEKAGT